MKRPSLREMAVMTMDEGEKIAGAWITPYIPEVGMYKLLAKKKKDGIYAWTHFIQRLNGNKDRVMRGETENVAQLNEVIEIAIRNLNTIYGVTLQPADADMYSLDGGTAPSILQ